MRFSSFKNDLPRRGLRFEIGAAALLAALCLYGAQLPRPQEREGFFDRWRAHVVLRIERIFDPPVSAWTAGLLLGADDGFSQKWKEVFRRTGTSHLTAVSGYNVGLVLSAVQTPLLRMPVQRRFRLLLAGCAILAFVFLTGAPGSVLRASLMIGAVELGRFLGRPVRPLRALLLAALMIGIISPRSLVADRGFQLSCLAAFGLATIAPMLQDALPRQLPRVAAEWISQTLAASLATAPLIAWMSGRYALLALPANVAVAAFIPLLMLLGAAVLGVSLLSSTLAFALAFLTRWIFMAPLALLRVLAEWRLASVSGLGAFVLLACVEAAALCVLWRRRRKSSLRYALYE